MFLKSFSPRSTFLQAVSEEARSPKFFLTVFYIFSQTIFYYLDDYFQFIHLLHGMYEADFCGFENFVDMSRFDDWWRDPSAHLPKGMSIREILPLRRGRKNPCCFNGILHGECHTSS